MVAATNNVSPAGSYAQVLTAENLTKSYGPRLALQNLSFSLRAGHILGFLGPNGAGKTTSIRILTTIMEPTSGQFTVDGISSKRPDLIRHKIGVLPENLGLPKNMTGIEYLTFFGQLYGRSASAARAHGLQLLDEIGLGKRATSMIGSYSHGMRQRLGIARALVNDPVVVFLDEPTLGLDPRGQQELLALVRRIARERNAGIILCSHLLSEIEGVCDEVVILNGGQIVAAGPVAEVVGRTQRDVAHPGALRLQVPPEMADQAGLILRKLPGVALVAPTGEMDGWLRLEFADSNGSHDHLANNRLLAALIKADIPILNLGSEGGRLQDAFLQLTEETIK